PFLDHESAEPCRALAEAVGAAHLKAHRWLPLREADGLVHVWTDEPSSPQRLAAIRAALSGRELRTYVGLPEDLLRAIESLGLPPEGRVAAAPRAAAALLLLLGLALPAWPMPAPEGADKLPAP